MKLNNIGPKIDWTKNAGLDNRFLVWKEECQLILEAPPKELRYVCLNIRAGSFGRQCLKLFSLAESEKKKTTVLFLKCNNVIRGTWQI